VAGYESSIYQGILARVPMFASCAPEQLDELARLGEADAHVDGDVIIREGEAAECFYVISSGHAVVSRKGDRVATLGAGDYFGELALFDPGPRSATVTADGATTVIALHRDQFRQALDDVPAIRDALLHGMAHRLHELDARA
jgi:CRP/FNR family transcriptional regulator, cyclic AMP receptor protein